MLQIDKAVKEQYPDTTFGIMIMTECVAVTSVALEPARSDLETSLQERFSGLDKSQMRAISPFSDYHNYYKRFRKTFHVLQQCESIASRKKQIPNGVPLVQSMFMAELKNQILTAGYDCSTLHHPFHVQLADGETGFNGMGKATRTPPKDDIIFTCDQKILGSIICGPDHEHRIQKSTNHVLFAAYGVPGISTLQIETHFQDISNFVRLSAPDTTIQDIDIL